MKTQVAPQDMQNGLPLSPGIEANGFLFVSGFGPQDMVSGMVPESIEEQTRAVFRNLESVLAQKHLGLTDVVKVTAHLQHLKRDFPGYNEVYADLMPAPYPVRTTVGSDLMDILVEIDVIAALGN